MEEMYSVWGEREAQPRGTRAMGNAAQHFFAWWNRLRQHPSFSHTTKLLACLCLLVKTKCSDV